MIFFSLAVTACMAVIAVCAEKQIRQSDLPAAVQKTVTQLSEGSVIRGFAKEVENGQTFYEVELTTNGHSKDITMDSSGVVVEVEEDISFDSLPAEVKAGLQTKAGTGKIDKVESLTKHGKLVAYEAIVRLGARTSEIQVAPDGKPLAHHE